MSSETTTLVFFSAHNIVIVVRRGSLSDVKVCDASTWFCLSWRTVSEKVPASSRGKPRCTIE